MIAYAEIEKFFRNLIAHAQSEGVPCGITSEMACVHFGVAATTKDCDVLCLAEKSDTFRNPIAETVLEGVTPGYRGYSSPPLDARWMRGGWTSHFIWKTSPEEIFLDIFGIASRGSSPWEQDLTGLYASRHTVAEMKRTNREKDWPYITALGLKMLAANDRRGCLHLYDSETLLKEVKDRPPLSWMIKVRPSLGLALAEDERLPAAIHAEIVFWHRLDARRIQLYEQALRPYANVVRKAIAQQRGASLDQSHKIRVECAERFLVESPIAAHGFGELLADARESTARLVHPDLMQWLPDAHFHFAGLL